MTVKNWKRVTVNLSDEEFANLKLLASLRKESVAAFVRYLLDIHLKANQTLIPLIKELRESTKSK